MGMRDVWRPFRGGRLQRIASWIRSGLCVGWWLGVWGVGGGRRMSMRRIFGHGMEGERYGIDGRLRRGRRRRRARTRGRRLDEEGC